MPYITREDGERFIIPSYRQVLNAKNATLLKKEMMLLSSSYGEYVNLQSHGINQYEAAFSNEPGYLLGESIWHYFKHPKDLIYCEVIPNTTEVILVVVKSGSVYLDGSFPMEAITDELVVFLTQKNEFEINVYGDVPISKEPEEGKFSLDSSSVKSFNVLPRPVFPTLPTLAAYQLQLLDLVLKQKGIGVFPIRKVLISLIVLGLLWMGYMFLTAEKKALPELVSSSVSATRPNPYELYVDALTSPDPSQELHWLSNKITHMLTLPGWALTKVDYSNGTLNVGVISLGAKITDLNNWAKENDAKITIKQTGLDLTMTTQFANRISPTTINRMDEVLIRIIDNLSNVLPGNAIGLGKETQKGKFKERELTITAEFLSPMMLDLVAQQLKDLPLVLSSASLNIDQAGVKGTVTLKALGN